MSEKKCFCHLNGFEVKDAQARREIEQLKTKVPEFQFYGPWTEGVTYFPGSVVTVTATEEGKQYTGYYLCHTEHTAEINPNDEGAQGVDYWCLMIVVEQGGRERAVYTRQYFNDGAVEVGSTISPWGAIEGEEGDLYIIPVCVPGGNTYNTVLAEVVGTNGLHVIAELSPVPPYTPKFVNFVYDHAADVKSGTTITIRGNHPGTNRGDYAVVKVIDYSVTPNVTHNTVVGKITTIADDEESNLTVFTIAVQAVVAPAPSKRVIRYHTVNKFGVATIGEVITVSNVDTTGYAVGDYVVGVLHPVSSLYFNTVLGEITSVAADNFVMTVVAELVREPERKPNWHTAVYYNDGPVAKGNTALAIELEARYFESGISPYVNDWVIVRVESMSGTMYNTILCNIGEEYLNDDGTTRIYKLWWRGEIIPAPTA